MNGAHGGDSETFPTRLAEIWLNTIILYIKITNPPPEAWTDTRLVRIVNWLTDVIVITRTQCE